MAKPAGTVEFDGVEVVRETEKAILVMIDDKEVWLPKTQIHDDSEVYKAGTSGKLVITEWIATAKGLV
jgi:hypothetical protein